MPRFAPVERFEDLPAPSSAEAREQYVLDYKGTVDPSKWWELAKDMAAFANALGGVILVGVKEGPPPAYDGLPVEVAERIQVAYENTAKEHLSPLPIVDAVLVRLPSGNALVAVNVNAYPDQPVGSRLPQANKNGDPVPYDAWQFPIRVGRHTRHLVPAMLPMLTNPVVRRIVILLESIPKRHEPSYQNPHVLWRQLGNQTRGMPQQTEVIIESIDPARNVIEFRSKSNSNTMLRAPLDDVEAVWEARDHTWYIRVSGSLTDKEYVSNPSDAVFRR